MKCVLCVFNDRCVPCLLSCSRRVTPRLGRRPKVVGPGLYRLIHVAWRHGTGTQANRQAVGDCCCALAVSSRGLQACEAVNVMCISHSCALYFQFLVTVKGGGEFQRRSRGVVI